MAFRPNNISQQDPAWRNERLGFSNLTIGTDGCTLVCLAILVNGFGYSETPKTLGQKLRNLGAGNGFLNALIVWAGLPRIYPQFKFRNLVLCRDQPAPLAAIDAALANGQAVLVEVDRSLASGVQNHWVVLYAKSGSDYLINDPWPFPVDDTETPLTRRYGFGRDAATIITAVVWYEHVGVQSPGPVTPPPPPVVVTPEPGFHVRVFTDLTVGLRLRSAPTTNSETLFIEPAGTLLRVLEDETIARTKVGVNNQWLHVRDPQGRIGFVAAWYVEAVQTVPSEPGPIIPDPQPGPQPPPPPDPQPEPQPGPVTAPTAQQIINAVNALRASKSLAAYQSNPVLNRAAQAQAEYMAASGNISHVDANGRKIAERLSAAGFVAEDSPAENILAGVQLTLAQAVEHWQSEPSMQATLLSPTHQVVGAGVAVVDQVVYYSLVSAKRREVAPPQPAPAPQTLTVLVSDSVLPFGLRLRSQPGFSGGILTVLQAGTRLTVIENVDRAKPKIGVEGMWLHVRDPQARSGYVAAWFVVEASNSTQPETPLLIFVSSSAAAGLRLRSGPSTGTGTVKVLPPNTRLTVIEARAQAEQKIGSSGQWIHVRDTAGDSGYVAAWFVRR